MMINNKTNNEDKTMELNNINSVVEKALRNSISNLRKNIAVLEENNIESQVKELKDQLRQERNLLIGMFEHKVDLKNVSLVNDITTQETKLEMNGYPEDYSKYDKLVEMG
tara:strand:+ start:7173 stop:7502 length:330 start_codon:yes stop_codon:yes gene_type:complete